MKWTFISLVMLVLGGWQPFVTAQEMESALPVNWPYRVSPEDVLDISVWREETLSKQVIVRPDGAISFPLVGEIQATGRTAEAIGEELTEKLKKYIPDPVVSVSVVKIAGYKIYVLGKVNRPGEYVVGRYVDVLQVLAMAGGLTPFADQDKIRIVRRYDGKEISVLFDYSAARKGKDLERNVVLQSGDTVVVP